MTAAAVKGGEVRSKRRRREPRIPGRLQGGCWRLSRPCRCVSLILTHATWSGVRCERGAGGCQLLSEWQTGGERPRSTDPGPGLDIPHSEPRWRYWRQSTTRTQTRGRQTYLLLCVFSPPPRYKPLFAWRGRAGEPCASGPRARADFTAGEALSCVTAPHHVSRRSLKKKKKRKKKHLQIRCRYDPVVGVPPSSPPVVVPGSCVFSLLPPTAPLCSALSLLFLLVYSRCLPACLPAWLPAVPCVHQRRAST